MLKTFVQEPNWHCFLMISREPFVFVMPSSVVAAMHYDVKSTTLRVVFVSGLVYDYKNVPEKVYLAMKNSGSKGIYLNTHIKGHYEFEKID